MTAREWTLDRIRRETPAGAFARAEAAAASGAVEAPTVAGGALLATVRTDRRYEVLVILDAGVSECPCEPKSLLPARLHCEHVAAALLTHLNPGLAREVPSRPRRETVVAVLTPDERHLAIRADQLRGDMRGVILTYRPYFRREDNAYLVPAHAEATLVRELTSRGTDFRIVREPSKPRILAAETDGESRILRIEVPEDENAERAVQDLRGLLADVGARWSDEAKGFLLPEARFREAEREMSARGVEAVTTPSGGSARPASGWSGARGPRAPAAPAPREAPVAVREERGPRAVALAPAEDGAFTLAPWEARGIPSSMHSLLRTCGFQEAEPDTWRGPPEGVVLAVSLLQARGIETRARPREGAYTGVRIHFHQRAPDAPVALRLLGGAAEARATLLDLCADAAEARPILEEDEEGVWLADDPAGFGRFLHGALAGGATPMVNLALRTHPLERVIVLVDQACLPPRLAEYRAERGPGARKPLVTTALVKVMEALIPEGWEEDKERGHLFLPTPRAGHIVESLRNLGADVQHRKLAPAKEQYREWPQWLPEDETGARPVKRTPWRGSLDRPIPGLREGTRLDSHQLEGVAFLLHHDHTCLLADEMGLGKTLQSIAAAQFLPGKVLVVCPASARSVWEREVAKWTHERSVVLQPGDDAAERLKEGHDAKYVVVAYSGLQRFIPALDPKSFDLVILDESHYIKNKRAKRTRAIVEHLVKVQRRLILSGTPVMNSPEEIRSQLAFLHPDEWSDEAWFRRRFVEPYHGGTTEVKEAILDALREHLTGVMLRREKRHALPDLPDKRFRVHHVPLAGEARRAYDSEEDGFRSYLREHEATALREEVVATAGRLERLKQAALVGKLPEVLRFAREHLEAGEKLVVFTKYVEPIKTIARELKAHGVVTLMGSTTPARRAEAVRAFQEDDETRVFVGQLVAAGTAITLTRAAHCVFLDLDWNPANHRQAMDRLHRKGQEREVTVHFFLAEDTVDEDIADVLEEKAAMMDLLLEGRKQGAFGLREERGLQQDVALRVLGRA